MRCLIAFLLCLAAATCVYAADGTAETPSADAVGDVTSPRPDVTAEDQAAKEVVNNLEEPLYTPFVERYVLDELRSLRQEIADTRVDLIQQVVDRELAVSDKAMSYASSTVNYFFYFIAAVSSILVIVGWTSIRDIKEKVHSLANTEVTKLVEIYEQRLRAIENQITQKTSDIEENREEIEKTNELHALWLRVGLEHTPSAKIPIYDEILKRRPNDYEALTYKAEAVLALNEPQWAVSLCQQALDMDPDFSHAFYQLACAKAAMGQLDEAVEYLAEAFNRMEIMDESLLNDQALDPLRDFQPFKDLVARRGGKESQ